MEDYNWKRELKKLAIEMCDGFYSIACMAIIAWAIISNNQAEAELQAMDTLINSKNYGFLFVVIMGLAVCGFALRFIITGTYKVIIVIFKLFIRK